MKRLIVPLLLMTFCFALGRETLSEKEDYKESWEKLKKIQLKTLKFTSVPEENTVKFNMQGIKNALEKAGITEKVTIELYVEDKLFGNLGTYGPDTKATKVKFSAIPELVKVKGMPETQGILRPARPARPETTARPARPARPAGPAALATAQSPGPKFGFLIFKNDAGAVMARLKVKLAGM